MSDEHDTASIAFNDLLRAEYAERQSARWAPEHLPKATRKRIAAAQALHRMGVDISLMRVHRIDAAASVLARRLATDGVQATVKRKGTRVVAECSQKFAASEPFRKWALGQGISWTSTHSGHREHEPASTLEFRLAAPGHETWLPEGSPTRSNAQPLASDEQKRVDDACETAADAVIAAGRVVLERSLSVRHQPTSSERWEALARRIMEGAGNIGPCHSDWREWSG